LVLQLQLQLALLASFLASEDNFFQRENLQHLNIKERDFPRDAVEGVTGTHYE